MKILATFVTKLPKLNHHSNRDVMMAMMMRVMMRMMIVMMVTYDDDDTDADQCTMARQEVNRRRPTQPAECCSIPASLSSQTRFAAALQPEQSHHRPEEERTG